MIDVRQTEVYALWFERLRDREARARILARIRRLSLGHFGEVEPVGEKVFEMKIDYGPGYRVHYTRRGRTVMVLLVGGDKHTQKRDIRRARELARAL